jgi:hypothetical protein
MMVDILNMEVNKFGAIKDKFVKEFSPEDYEYIEEVGGRGHHHLPPPRGGGASWCGARPVTRPGVSSPPPNSRSL